MWGGGQRVNRIYLKKGMLRKYRGEQGVPKKV